MKKINTSSSSLLFLNIIIITLLIIAPWNSFTIAQAIDQAVIDKKINSLDHHPHRYQDLPAYNKEIVSITPTEYQAQKPADALPFDAGYIDANGKVYISEPVTEAQKEVFEDITRAALYYVCQSYLRYYYQTSQMPLWFRVGFAAYESGLNIDDQVIKNAVTAYGGTLPSFTVLNNQNTFAANNGLAVAYSFAEFMSVYNFWKYNLIQSVSSTTITVEAYMPGSATTEELFRFWRRYFNKRIMETDDNLRIKFQGSTENFKYFYRDKESYCFPHFQNTLENAIENYKILMEVSLYDKVSFITMPECDFAVIDSVQCANRYTSGTGWSYGLISTCPLAASELTNFDGLVEHELAHVIQMIVKPNFMPAWLSEGFASFLDEGIMSEQKIRNLSGEVNHRMEKAKITIGHYPTIAELEDYNFVGANGIDYYLIGAIINNFIVKKSGYTALKPILVSNGQDFSSIGFSTKQEFETAFYNYYDENWKPDPKIISIKKVVEKPIIDGRLSEPTWEMNYNIDRPFWMDYYMNTNPTIENVCTSSIMWDTENLNIAMKVVDNNISDSYWFTNHNDAVEIDIDPDLSRGIDFTNSDMAFTFIIPSSQVIYRTDLHGANIVKALTSNGYSVEAAVPWTLLGVTPSPGIKIGLELANYDRDNNVYQGALIFSGHSWNNGIVLNGLAEVTLSNEEIIIPESLTLTSSAGGESYQTSSMQNITWNSSGVTNIKLEYSSDNGNNWNLISESVNASAGTYSWQIPNITAYECKIKISNSNNPALNAISDGIFITYPELPVSVEPLLSVEYTVFTWPLNAYYPVTNPSDGQIINGRVGNACGPTAMSNIMRYWEFPRKGSGARTFTDAIGCTWSADFNNTIYNYDRMPGVIPQDATQDVYDAAATLMYHTGTGMFDPWRSGNRDGVLNAFKEYFNYEQKAVILNRDEYTTGQWEKIVKSELSSGRPLIVEGWSAINPDGSHAGHWFICDGYTNANQYHIRFDYGPESDGYFPLYEFGEYKLKNWIFAYLEPRLNGKELQLTSPAGNEDWQHGTQKTITWTSNNVSSIRIEYSTNNGYDWSTLDSNIPAGSGSHTLIIPQGVSEECRFRITDESDINVYSKNKTPFSVYDTKTLTLLSPKGGEHFQSGSKAAIVWVSSGFKKIDIEYKIGENGAWNIIVENVNAASGIYKWQIPDITSEIVKVRLKESGGEFETESAAGFSVTPIAVPGGPYAVDVNTVLLMHFDNDIIDDAAGTAFLSIGKDKVFPLSEIPGLGKSIRFDNTEQNGSCISAQSTNSLKLSGSWTIDFWFYINSWDKNYNNWPVPFIKLNNGLESNYSLEIPAPEKRFKFGFFSAGQKITLYSAQNIVDSKAWYHITLINDFSNKKLKLILRDSTKEKIYESSLNYPSGTVISTGNGVLRIGNGFAGDNQFDGYLDEFRISNIVREFRSLNIIVPDGGENLIAGNSFNIKWSCQDIQYVKLEYTTDNGTSWNLIANNVNAKSGSYNWNVPNTISANCKVRINDQSDDSFNDISESIFSISSKTGITLTQPNSGEKWAVGSQQEVSWTSEGIAQVNLKYSTNNGSSWLNIATVPAFTGTYNWEVPNTPSENCLVKIENTADPNIFDISNSTFTIDPLSSAGSWANGIPDKYELYQNYPNPFNPVSGVRYQLPKQSNVKIILYDIIGNEVMNMVNEFKDAGYYEVEVNGSSLTSGIYLLKMDSSEFSSIKKIILLK